MIEKSMEVKSKIESPVIMMIAASAGFAVSLALTLIMEKSYGPSQELSETITVCLVGLIISLVLAVAAYLMTTTTKLD